MYTWTLIAHKSADIDYIKTKSTKVGKDQK